MLVDFLKEVESQVLFYGNKIRTGANEKEKAWFEAYNAAMQAFKAFLSAKREFICMWRGKEDGAGAEAFFKAQSIGGAASSASAAPKEESKSAPASSAPAKAAAKKPDVKEPKKTLVMGKKWMVQHYKGENMVFKDNEVNTKMQFCFLGMQNCMIEIDGKCQMVNLINCKNVKLRLDKTILGIELTGCETIDIRNRNPEGSINAVTI